MSSKFAIINMGCVKELDELTEDEYTVIGTSNYLNPETEDLVKRLNRNTPIVCIDNGTDFKTLDEYLDSLYVNNNNKKRELFKEFITSKEFLVNAHEEDSYFFAFELQDKTVISIEIQPMSYPDKTVCHYETIKNFVDNTEWHDWIIVGIINEDIKKLIN